jgi:hypothetical protein
LGKKKQRLVQSDIPIVRLNPRNFGRRAREREKLRQSGTGYCMSEWHRTTSLPGSGPVFSQGDVAVKNQSNRFKALVDVLSAPSYRQKMSEVIARSGYPAEMLSDPRRLLNIAMAFLPRRL